MKKLLIALLCVCCSLAFADDNCSAGAKEVVKKLAKFNRTSVTLNYSSDKAQRAQTCKTAILAQNPALTVTLNQVDGSGKFKFSK